MTIQITIDRLILEGISLSPSQQRQLQAAMERELGRLLLEGGLASQFHQPISVPSIAAGPISLPPNATPTQLGDQIAHTVYRGLGA